MAYKKTKANYGLRKAFGRGVKVGYARGKKACAKKKKATSSTNAKPKTNVLIIDKAGLKDVNLTGYKFAGAVPNSKNFLVFKKEGK